MDSVTHILKLRSGHFIHAEHFRCLNSRGTIVMVNGAFATIASLHHTIRYLSQNYDVIAFDLPFSGSSYSLNQHHCVLSKEQEVEILLEVFEHFKPDYSISMSWGGVSMLLALAQHPKYIRRAVIGSFAPSLSVPMRDYLQRTMRLLSKREYSSCADLFNNTLGRTLPRRFKVLNARHLKHFANSAHEQIEYHIQHILDLEPTVYRRTISKINIPLMFINGALDVYTPSEKLRDLEFPLTTTRYEVVQGAGHFLDMESKALCNQMKILISDFLLEEERYDYVEYS